MVLTREQFKEEVFKRDHGKCVICGATAVDAHHILDRSLWIEDGYYVDNGVALCGDHHLQAEYTTISCKDLREKAGITTVLLPDHFFLDEDYDHWGNIVLPSGMRIKGELFGEAQVQKVISRAGLLNLFLDRVKYPRTYHAPWSPNLQNDDRMHDNVDFFIGQECVATVKMDGENCFSPDTKIDTEVGKRSIESLCTQGYRGSVLANDEDGNDTWASVEGTRISEEERDWIEITTEDGTTLYVTEGQLVYLPELGCYRQAKYLKAGDFLQKS